MNLSRLPAPTSAEEPGAAPPGPPRLSVTVHPDEISVGDRHLGARDWKALAGALTDSTANGASLHGADGVPYADVVQALDVVRARFTDVVVEP